jgi:hypothetical protein
MGQMAEDTAAMKASNPEGAMDYQEVQDLMSGNPFPLITPNPVLDTLGYNQGQGKVITTLLWGAFALGVGFLFIEPRK